MALLRVPSTSVTNSQNTIPIPVETSLCFLSTICPSDTSSEEITSSRFFKISLVPKIPRKYSIEKIATLFFIVAEEGKYRG
jgi:hypothetical protein